MNQNELFQLLALALEISSESLDIDSGNKTITKWDSLGMISIGVAIESACDIQLSTDEIASLTSVQDIVSVLKKKGVWSE